MDLSSRNLISLLEYSEIGKKCLIEKMGHTQGQGRVPQYVITFFFYFKIFLLAYQIFT